MADKNIVSGAIWPLIGPLLRISPTRVPPRARAIPPIPGAYIIAAENILLRLCHRTGKKENGAGEGQEHPGKSAAAVPRLAHWNDFVAGVRVDFGLHGSASFED